MYSQDENGHKMLELHVWVAFIFNKETGELAYTTTHNTKQKAEKWWEEQIHSVWDVRYTMASIREFQ